MSIAYQIRGTRFFFHILLALHLNLFYASSRSSQSSFFSRNILSSQVESEIGFWCARERVECTDPRWTQDLPIKPIQRKKQTLLSFRILGRCTVGGYFLSCKIGSGIRASKCNPTGLWLQRLGYMVLWGFVETCQLGASAQRDA